MNIDALPLPLPANVPSYTGTLLHRKKWCSTRTWCICACEFRRRGEYFGPNSNISSYLCRVFYSPLVNCPVLPLQLPLQPPLPLLSPSSPSPLLLLTFSSTRTLFRIPTLYSRVLTLLYSTYPLEWFQVIYISTDQLVLCKYAVPVAVPVAMLLCHIPAYFFAYSHYAYCIMSPFASLVPLCYKIRRFR